MLCYKDKTFCNMYLLCKDGYNCDRAYTKEIADGATKLNLPVSLFADIPECFNPIFEEEEI